MQETKVLSWRCDCTKVSLTTLKCSTCKKLCRKLSALDKVNAAMCALDLQNIHTCVKARRAVRNRAKVRVRGYEGEEARKDPARIDPATQSGYRCMSLDIVLINNPSILSCYSCPLSAVRVVGHSALLLLVFWVPF